MLTHTHIHKPGRRHEPSEPSAMTDSTRDEKSVADMQTHHTHTHIHTHQVEDMRAKLSAMMDSTEDEKSVADVQAQMKQMRGPFAANDKGHVQCVLAAATVPESVRKIVQETFPKFGCVFQFRF